MCHCVSQIFSSQLKFKKDQETDVCSFISGSRDGSKCRCKQLYLESFETNPNPKANFKQETDNDQVISEHHEQGKARIKNQHIVIAEHKAW